MIYALPLAILAAVVAAETENPWATYPSVPKTATINGFADPVFDSLPECAQPCVKQSVSSTPCPYWDTGCLCVMTTWSSSVTECYAKNCKGDDAQKAFDASVAVCKKVGVWEPYWIINAAASAAIESAAAEKQEETTSSAQPTTSVSSTDAQPTEETTTTQGEPTSATSSAAPETTAPETSAQSSAAQSSAAETSAHSSAAQSSAAHSSAAQSSAAQSSGSASVSSYEGAANGVVPAAAIGVAAGIAMLL